MIVVQFLTGLADASCLFLAASGLSLIFGVTRVVNFAQGAFYMLGAYVAYSLATRLDGPFGFFAGLILAAGFVAILGALLEMTLLRRLYGAPEPFVLLATFGVTLMVEDIVVLVWGAPELVGPRAPGLGGTLDVLGLPVPAYDLLLIALGPLVLLGLRLMLKRSRWGTKVRASMREAGDAASSFGVDKRRLFTGVFALGVFLAALGGALQVPRIAITHEMDLSIIVEVFIVATIGGLASLTGAFLAAILVAELNAFGVLVFPGASPALAFLIMGAVLLARPRGLFGRTVAVSDRRFGIVSRPWKVWSNLVRLAACVVALLAALLPLVLGPSGLAIGSQALIAVIFALSLSFMMSVGGMISFGHAAFFGLGAYGAALSAERLGAPMELALVAGVATALAGAIVFGSFIVRLSGLVLAMLTLAFAQILWSIAVEWGAVTGGATGILGLRPSAWASDPKVFYWLTLVAAVGALATSRVLVFSPFGYRLRALRDSPERAAASGIDGRRTHLIAFAYSGALAGVAGSLFAFWKGSVFPDVLSIRYSIDALVMVLLGGVGTLSGAVVGAVTYTLAATWPPLGDSELPRLLPGALIVLLAVAVPHGIKGSLERFVTDRRDRSNGGTRERYDTAATRNAGSA